MVRQSIFCTALRGPLNIDKAALDRRYRPKCKVHGARMGHFPLTLRGAGKTDTTIARKAVIFNAWWGVAMTTMCQRFCQPLSVSCVLVCIYRFLHN